METINNRTIGSLVAENFKAASVFQKFGIDFCCKGNRTIEDACSTQNLDAKEVEKEVSTVMAKKEQSAIDYNSWPIDLLADYIEKTHHRYVAETIPELNLYLNKLCKVHGAKHPELLTIYKHFLASAEELSSHMIKEENILFPFIRAMVKAKRNKSQLDRPSFTTVQNPISMMMQEHDAEGSRFREISRLSNSYTVPDDGCTTYRVAFALLKEFEEDLHTHIHLENNILFPKAISMEASFMEKLD